MASSTVRWRRAGPSIQWGWLNSRHSSGLSVPVEKLAPATAISESSFANFSRIVSATSCKSNMWSSGISSSDSSVTSACIPIRNHRCSPVCGLRAMLSPRRSRRFMNSSPDFFLLGMTAVYGTPVALETLSLARSEGSMSQPWLRKRQFTPRISLRWNLVMLTNSSETAMRGQSGPLGSAMVTMNLQSATAALMLLNTATSFTTEERSGSGPVH
mmetsp:Transcript_54794/g.163115  ORF Transcript_54794/g.163115 Transcript_54794/m.163115 type:complete len:214 (+) Transcript_54794:273-914(+)